MLYTGEWGPHLGMKERVDGKANPSWKDSLLHLYLLRVDYDRGKIEEI